MVKSCCCFDLKTGCMYIGTGDIVLSVISMMSSLIALSSDNIDSGKGISIIVGAIFSILAAVFLILGVMDGHPGFLVFWLVLKGIAIVVLCLLIILLMGAVSDIAAAEKEGPAGGPQRAAIAELAYIITSLAVFIALNMYFCAVVDSYRAELSLKRRSYVKTQKMAGAKLDNSNLGYKRPTFG